MFCGPYGLPWAGDTSQDTCDLQEVCCQEHRYSPSHQQPCWVSSWHPALSKTKLQEAAGTAGEPKHCYPKLSGHWVTFSLLTTEPMLAGYGLQNFFFYLGICATSTSHWGDSCPKPCAHEAGEPVLCLKLLGQRRALRFLSSPWPHCVSCSWAGSLLLQSPTVGASTRALLSLLWSLLAICATQCCFSLDHVCSVDGYFK